ncbi:hypothetical protein HYH03_003564 [Edaphochlamys debaryana]|uniref:Uncharacterized protein n=1 Tax=Edaphochlamys debaryana TaxID=47281 RepID=A0A835Y938_9CHLO|nr:hypothetical protein HYH03_003564 [Edaphochlamys debaryana]|eukprot:KAG2498303.1 hypothetical protein HYH03_003564 [Edaphochlamys debaryana]
MGLITFSLFAITALLTSPVWVPTLILFIVAPHVPIFIGGAIALLTSPIWIPLSLVAIPVAIITSPIWPQPRTCLCSAPLRHNPALPHPGPAARRLTLILLAIIF